MRTLAGVSPVLMQMWAGVGPVLMQMWAGVGPVSERTWAGVSAVPAQMWQGGELCLRVCVRPCDCASVCVSVVSASRYAGLVDESGVDLKPAALLTAAHVRRNVDSAC